MSVRFPVLLPTGPRATTASQPGRPGGPALLTFPSSRDGACAPVPGLPGGNFREPLQKNSAAKDTRFTTSLRGFWEKERPVPLDSGSEKEPAVRLDSGLEKERPPARLQRRQKRKPRVEILKPKKPRLLVPSAAETRAVLLLQRCVRGRAGRKEAKNHRLLLLDTVYKLQKWFRGRQLIRAARRQTDELRREQKKLNMTITSTCWRLVRWKMTANRSKLQKINNTLAYFDEKLKDTQRQCVAVIWNSWLRYRYKFATPTNKKMVQRIERAWILHVDRKLRLRKMYETAARRARCILRLRMPPGLIHSLTAKRLNARSTISMGVNAAALQKIGTSKWGDGSESDHSSDIDEDDMHDGNAALDGSRSRSKGGALSDLKAPSRLGGIGIEPQSFIARMNSMQSPRFGEVLLVEADIQSGLSLNRSATLAARGLTKPGSVIPHRVITSVYSQSKMSPKRRESPKVLQPLRSTRKAIAIHKAAPWHDTSGERGSGSCTAKSSSLALAKHLKTQQSAAEPPKSAENSQSLAPSELQKHDAHPIEENGETSGASTTCSSLTNSLRVNTQFDECDNGIVKLDSPASPPSKSEFNRPPGLQGVQAVVRFRRGSRAGLTQMTNTFESRLGSKERGSASRAGSKTSNSAHVDVPKVVLQPPLELINDRFGTLGKIHVQTILMSPNFVTRAFTQDTLCYVAPPLLEEPSLASLGRRPSMAFASLDRRPSMAFASLDRRPSMAFHSFGLMGADSAAGSRRQSYAIHDTVPSPLGGRSRIGSPAASKARENRPQSGFRNPNAGSMSRSASPMTKVRSCPEQRRPSVAASRRQSLAVSSFTENPEQSGVPASLLAVSQVLQRRQSMAPDAAAAAAAAAAAGLSSPPRSHSALRMHSGTPSGKLTHHLNFDLTNLKDDSGSSSPKSSSDSDGESGSRGSSPASSERSVDDLEERRRYDAFREMQITIGLKSHAMNSHGWAGSLH